MSSPLLSLTGAQLGIWNAQSLSPESPYYVVGEVLQLGPGHIELETLQHSITQLQQEVETLRARVTLDGTTPFQRVVQETPGIHRLIDVRGAVDPQRSAEAWVDALRAECAETMRSMVDQPLCRYSIILLDAQNTWVVQLYHHLIIDGYSASLLTRRLGQIYTARVMGTKAPPFRPASLSELVALDQEYCESEEYARDVQYWTARLAELPDSTERAAMNTATKENGVIQTTITTTVRLEPWMMEQLTAVASDEQITWVELMISLYGAFVHRLCSPHSASEQILAVPVMARTRTAELRTPAMTVNVLPLRIQIDNQQTVQEYLRRAVNALRGLLAHQRLRGESLPQVTGVSRVADLLHGVGVNAKAFTTRTDFAGIPGRLRNVAGGPPEDLGLVLTPADDGGLDIAFETDPTRVSAEHARTRLESLREFTRQALEDPVQRIGDLMLHSQEQREEILEQRCVPSDDVAENDGPQDALGFALATLQCQSQMHLVVHSANSWNVEPRSEKMDLAEQTREVLDAKALHTAMSRLAGYFRREVLGSSQWRQSKRDAARGGLQPVLALELERGSELVIAVLAAFAAGVPFVCIDPTSPAQRREQIYANAEPVIHMDAQAICQALGEGNDNRTDASSEWSGSMADCPAPDELAYLIYTSGSTGQPKGVEVPRRAISSLFAQHRAGMYDRAHAVVAHTASFSFDAALDQLLWLVAGHDVHLYPEQASEDADRLVEHFAAQQISVVDTTPSMMKALLDAQLLEKVPSLQLVVLGGEELPAELWDHLADTGLEVINAYGPTECTVDAMLAQVEPGIAHLGRPIPGMRAYLVDNALQLVGDGDVGELVLAGPQLALGYRGLPEATSVAFVEGVCIDPRQGRERVYRTGDRARWVPGRGYQFLGRADGQVEINGQRVELFEVEKALSRLSGVRDCAVAPLNRSGQTTVLIAAVVVESSAVALDSGTMRRQLEAALPAAAIPRHIYLVRSLPTTTSGKLDRQAISAYALPSLKNGAQKQTVGIEAAKGSEIPSTITVTTGDTTDPLAALSPSHLLLHETVCDVLRLPPQQVDPHQDFISLGGESIAALHVASRVRQQGLTLRPKDLLGGTSLAQIPVTFHVPETENPTGFTTSTSLRDVGVVASDKEDIQWLDWGELPWNPVARMQIAAAPTIHAMRRHVMYQWLDVPPQCGRDDVLRAVEVLQRRHASLRMLLDWDNEAQLIPRVPLTSAAEIVSDLVSNCPDPVEQLVSRIAPDRGVMWQIGLCGKRALLMVHHLAIDALSWQNLEREWNAAMIHTSAKLPVTNGRLRAHGLRWGVTRQSVQNVLPGKTELSGQLLCPRGQTTAVCRAIEKQDAAAMSSELARRFRTRRQTVVVALLARALQTVGLGKFQLVVEGHGRDGGLDTVFTAGSDSTGSAVDCMALIGWFTTEECWCFALDEDDSFEGSYAGSASKMAELVRTAREAESCAQPWALATCPPRRRIVINVLDTQFGERFGVLESDERRMTEALTINVFLSSEGADVEYVADLEALGGASPALLEELHEQFQCAARNLLVADRLKLRQALPSDYLSQAGQPCIYSRGRGSSDQATPTLTAADLRRLEAIHGPLVDIVPATASQQGLLYQALTDNDYYVIAAAVELTGVKHPELIHRAMQEILRRHAALRAVFDCSHRPLMLIPERLDLPWAVHDCRDLSTAAARTMVEELRELRARRTVDLECGPLVTADLVLMPEANQSEANQPATLVLGSHHILTDGWSTAVLLRDLQRLLDGEELEPAPSFAEFARTLHQRSGDDLDLEYSVWLRMFTGSGQTDGTNCMGKYGRVVSGLQQAPPHQKNGAEAQEMLRVLHRDTDGRVVDAAMGLGTTPSVLVQTAWVLTLAALRGGHRVTTGVTLSGRPVDQPRMADTIGMFITTLPLHVHLEPEQTLGNTVQQVAETMALISDNQATPLQDIERLVGGGPLFDTAVVYDHHTHFGMPDGLSEVESIGVHPRIQRLHTTGRTHYPLTVVCPPGDVLEIMLVHHPDVVGQSLVDAAARWFTTFLRALCGDPSAGETRLVDLLPRRGEFEKPLASRVDMQEVVIEASGEPDYSEESTVCALVQESMESLLGKPIGPEEDFFASGGDSLLAIRLMGLLRKQGLRLKIQDIVDTGAPVAIAERLREGTRGGLNPKSLGQRQYHQHSQDCGQSLSNPLWCIHPISGHGLAFAPLARFLAPTSFVPRLIELPSPLPKVETLVELSEFYTAKILAEQQKGPFALVGYSFGGVVAECIAAELQRRGHEVSFLGILDTYPCGSGSSTDTHSVLHNAPQGKAFTSDYDVQAIARADGAFHELTREGVDIENNIRFCMQMLSTAESTGYEGSVELVVATRHNDDLVRGQWNPVDEWRRHPGVRQLRVSELDLTHAELVQEGGWKQIFRDWAPRLLGDNSAAPAVNTATHMYSTPRSTQQLERTDPW